MTIDFKEHDMMIDKRRAMIGWALTLAAWPGTAGAQTAEPTAPVGARQDVVGGSAGPLVGGPSYTSPLATKWGRQVTAANAWRSYPRPQLVRKDWLNLNGEWDYAIRKLDQPRPDTMDGKILVPFAPESKLSGVARKVLPDDRLWYRRQFEVPAGWAGKRVLLHFGAVDFESAVWVNGALVGGNRGGSKTFSFDVTPYLKAGSNELVVRVADPTSEGGQPRGKQTLSPRGIWYTAVSGIWQTVWLEPVPDLHIQELRTQADVDTGQLLVDVVMNKAARNTDAVLLTASSKGKIIARTLVRGNRRTALSIPNATLWSPDKPFLYDLSAELITVADPTAGFNGHQAEYWVMSPDEAAAYPRAKITDRTVRDRVDGYFAMRKIAIGPDPATGKPVMLLNGKAVFHNGVLDQGWWPDGLLTPPSEEAMKSDLEFLKQAGFNMVRKHIKVEPARFYYDADHLGILIWQDMPFGALGDQGVTRGSDREATFSSDAQGEYQAELAAMIGDLRSFPSIVMWVTNNEGWGQYDSRTVAGLAKSMDPSRLVNSASGWLDTAPPAADVIDLHTYEVVPEAPKPDGRRAIVVGEYGGIGLPIDGHLWFTKRPTPTYQTATDRADYLRRYRVKMNEIIRQKQALGLSGSVYTQTTDVEGEVNGLLTYDRAVAKLPPATLSQIAAPLAEPNASVAPAR